MRSSAVFLLLAAGLLASAAERPPEYAVALPGYHYAFPRDHFNHPEYQTEWWYYTGNLRAADGRKFGFELTFFRLGVGRDAGEPTVWSIDDLYLAHLALSDIGGQRFFYTERLNRAGPGFAGASLEKQRIWNGNWEIGWDGQGAQKLRGVAAEFTLQLGLRALKAPVIHGAHGLSQKAAGTGHASHYISLSRLQADGSLVLQGRTFQLSGTAWMDHEFFTHQLDAGQTGWDWMSIQLGDGSDLMLYRLRRRDGTADPFSAGTYIDKIGGQRNLTASDFILEPGRTWTSPETKAQYPVTWKVQVPALGLKLDLFTNLDTQELVSHWRGPSYWEGAVELKGSREGRPVEGVGYLEMTGYAGGKLDF